MIDIQIGGFSVLTRQTNIIWVAFIMAVSIVRELKQADIVEGGQTFNSLRSWLMFDPLAAEATFPGIPRYFPGLTISGLPCGGSTDGVRDGQTYDYSVAYIMFFGPVFAGFGVFLLWNQGIVLGMLHRGNIILTWTGDKSNHIAGINIPQILYCSTFIAAFAFPVLLSPGLISTFLHSVLSTPRRILNAVTISLILLVIIHYNT